MDLRPAHNTAAAMRALFQGQPGFFKPRFPPPFLSPFAGDAATSFYDTGPLRDTLLRLVDFDRLNSGDIRVSVGAVNVRSGNFVYFDTAERRLGPEHFMASGALPPGFPAVEIEGKHYWDGGVVSNTPLSYVLSTEPRRDTLTFQVDLWSAKGRMPDDLMEVSSRQKDIQYSSRTRAITNHMLQMQKMRQALQTVMQRIPQAAMEDPEIKTDRGSGLPPRLQHRPSDLPVEDVRRPLQGLRVRAGCDARALAERPRRHPPHAGRSAPAGPPGTGHRRRHPRHPSRRMSPLPSSFLPPQGTDPC